MSFFGLWFVGFCVVTVLGHIFFACPRRWGGCGRWHWIARPCKPNYELQVTSTGLKRVGKG